jgi:hypothetical protein
MSSQARSRNVTRSGWEVKEGRNGGARHLFSHLVVLPLVISVEEGRRILVGLAMVAKAAIAAAAAAVGVEEEEWGGDEEEEGEEVMENG